LVAGRWRPAFNCDPLIGGADRDALSIPQLLARAASLRTPAIALRVYEYAS
jgi:hypothetical protein